MKQTELIMGMPITVEIVGAESQFIEQVFDYFRHVDTVFSTFKPDSEISRFNRGEIEKSRLSDEVREVLAACQRLKLRTSGYFDIARGNGIDPSGLVKGWAIWNAADLIEHAGFINYCVDAGGDIQLGGTNETGGYWQVGLRHPVQKDKVTAVMELTNSAVATSGTYERGQHIYNPHTGEAVTDPIALTVVGTNIEDADVIATAAFAMGPQKALDFVASQGMEGYMITADHRAQYTEGFRNYLKS